jgi:FAD:protein FMN transferase
MKKIFIKLFLLLLLIVFFIVFIFYKNPYTFSGYTMGTYYKVVIYSKYISPTKLTELENEIKNELVSLNNIFSNYVEDSELNNWNKHVLKKYVSLSDELVSVLEISKEIYELTNGYFDPTVLPLVNVWGFGNSKMNYYPSKEDISRILDNIGFDNIVIYGHSVMKKKNVKLGLASVAKGYAVDSISDIIRNYNEKNFLVDIGGDLFINGNESFKDGWEVYITDPAIPEKNILSLRIKNKGVATSGTYRNYKVYAEKQYQHIINPKTGYPSSNDLVSVTVIAENTAKADALATGLMVLGLEEGLRLVNSTKGIEAVFIKHSNNNLIVFKSNGI